MTPIEWLLSSDTGVSSETICAVMTGSVMKRADVPHDGGDFGRCHRLLQKFPEWRARLSEVTESYPAWGPMVREWDALTAQYESGDMQGLYKRMQPLIDEGRLADGWVKKGNCWSREGEQILELGPRLSVSFGK